MTKKALLLGRTGIVLDEVRAHLQVEDVDLHSGTSLDDVRRIFESEAIDVVIMGAGIDLETRVEIVRHIYTVSNSTTVHMKDWDSGPAGMIPFVNAVLSGITR